MIKPILYLHAGMHKTGTTSIQNFLWINYNTLLTDSILYPLTGRDELFQHHYLFSSIREPEHPNFKPKKEFSDYLIDLENEISLTNPEKVVLSSEIFCELYNVDTKILSEKLQSLFILFSVVKVIFYIRRPDLYCISENSTLIWYDDRKEHQLYFPNIIDWQNILNKDKIIFRPFEKNQFIDKNLFSDFLSILGILKTEKYDYARINLNVSYDDDIVEFCRIINNSHLDITAKIVLKRDLLNAFPNSIKPNNAFFSPQQQIDLINENAKPIETIARDFLGREDGKLFYEPLSNPDDPWEPYKGLPVEMVVKGFSYLLNIQQEQINSQSN